ncbi:thioredoxin family protein [Mycobacterium lacus]|uniref:Thiol reductase thioredoxin n=1 Tax=Mycobacterium lacus TaxID=169765 RepID=A0A1X1YTP6_9MYCO|nr:thioredoxin family protein [Mycobacterium lacus]MCV7123690.1 thioredoxin family protein [Mycobacterium lacus]ORW14452.1 thioredoxin [Mycobacterium lacus]BBX95370.1 thiol reductase thioredoxin [Mycobacterium lacus]
MTTRDLTAANFLETINGNEIVLVYVWSTFCPACLEFTPTYEDSSTKHPDIVHGKVDFEIEKELVTAAKVRFMPVLMAFKNGALVFKQGGIARPAVLEELIRQLRVYDIDSAAVGGGTHA